MTARTLTKRFVETVNCDPAGRLVFSDALLPGFELRVNRNGSKAFSFRCRLRGKQVRASWPWPQYELAQAREAARQFRQDADLGQDPRADQKVLPKVVNDLADRYRDEYLRPKVRRWQAALGEIDNHIRPTIGTEPLATLSRAHVREVIKAAGPAGPVAANRALMRLRAMLRWGLGEDLVETDVSLGVKRPTNEAPRERILSDGEIREIWKATEKLGYPACDLIRALILTGQRRDDVREMSWNEVNLGEGRWTIPTDRYKGRRPHLVPLVPAMVDLLGGLPFQDRGAFVFSAAGGETAYSNLVKPKRNIDRRIRQHRAEQGYDREMEAWTLHDIRRTVRTGMSRLGVSPDVAERVIGHQVGGRLTQTYDRHEFEVEKRDALERWADHVAGVLAGNVVRLDRRGTR